MNTNNIISTPDITGNIGSCTSQVVVVDADRLSVWKEKTISISTNSCTGEVTKYETWSYTPACFAVFTITVVFSILFICIINAIKRPMPREWC